MEKRTIQTHWNGKIKKLAGIIAGTLGEENHRMKRPEPHFGFGKYIRLYDDGRLEIDSKASEVDVLTLIDVLVERGAITVEEADSVADAAVAETESRISEETGNAETPIVEAEEIEASEPEPTEESVLEQAEESAQEPIEEPAQEQVTQPEHIPEPEQPTQSEHIPELEEAPIQITQPAESDENPLTISFPRSSFTDTALDNLVKLIESKETLFKKSIGTDSLEIKVTDDTVSFPWFKADGTEQAKAYTDFIKLLCDKARNAKRITAKERDVENERYAMRVFLISIGGNGEEYSVMRRVLLKGLSGSSAFRDKKRKSEIA